MRESPVSFQGDPMPEKGYESVSLPSQLLDQVRAFLKEHPELAYASMSEFVKDAVRTRIDLAAAIDRALQRRQLGKRVPTGEEIHEVYLEAIDSIASAVSREHPEDEEEILTRSGRRVRLPRQKKVDRADAQGEHTH